MVGSRGRSAILSPMKRTKSRPTELFPEIEPYREGMLSVSDLHTIHWEECGNPKGKPLVFLHGGPGGGIDPVYRRYFDPKKWRIVLFSQRGCGKSTPHAELRENTTWDLVADIEKLRAHLGIDKWVVFGGSWGSTLSLAYAQTHTSRVQGLVLRGIFLLRRSELLWFYQEGASHIFPDAWERYLEPIPPRERGDMMAAYYKRLTSKDKAVRARREGVVDLGRHDQQAVRRPQADRALRRRRVRGRVRAHRGALLRQQGLPQERRPAAQGREEAAQDPGRDRAGPLRRRVPDALGVGPAQGVARGQVHRRQRRRPLDDRGRNPRGADQRDGRAGVSRPAAASTSAYTGRRNSTARASASSGATHSTASNSTPSGRGAWSRSTRTTNQRCT